MTDLFSLKGKTALITGASGGLGWRFAATLANSGANVVITARRRERLTKLAGEIEAKGGMAFPVCMDVTRPESIVQAIEDAEDYAGEIHIVVNNAGIAIGERALDTNDADWDSVIETNLNGAFRVARETGRHMSRHQIGGSIINIASILGFRVSAGVAAYATAKAGLIHLTRSLALEWARHDIRVNAIAPGYILTDLNRKFFETDASKAVIERIPQRRIGQPGDLDGALLLLASGASRYMTGSVITVDGGHMQTSL